MIGTRLAHYEITAHVGSGGMGHVYRATDAKLGRSVAIKMLPEEFARDAERIARLEREARTLASLNHPSIAAIYGLEESDGRSFLVMEYVAGDTLAERLQLDPLPIDEALAIALQIATALEAAHESGVMHRDLKPANIKITKDGNVKLLDFGLAKAFAADQRSDVSQSPTLSVMATRAGAILGTAAYMSPEQARGKEIDRRSDIFAFGCVLYEMLTGRQAFEGETASEVLARVIEREPDWSKLPADVPPRVRELLQRCLEKDPKKRRRDSGDVRIDLEQALVTPVSTGAVAEARFARQPTVGARARWVALGAVVATAILMAIGIAGIARYWPVRPTTRFTVTVPRGSDLQSFAVSPDGRYLAFAAGRSLETSLLFVRPIDSVDARPIPGTEGAVRPFWAPDSQRIGFASQGWLKTVALSGGSPQLLAEIGPVFFVGAWGTNDVILFSAASEIRRVSAAGGEVVPVTELTAAEESHGAVSFLPGGQRFLYGTATGRPGVYIGSLESTERRPLLPWFGRAQYASGFLLFNRDGALLAQAFDPDRLTFGGEPIRIADGLALGASVGAFSTSNAGVLAYRIEDADDTGLEQSRLVWYDRAGNPLGAVGAPDAYRGFELSPDGRYVAAHIHDGSSGGGIWVLDQQRSNDFGRLALGPEHVTSPTWSPGSERIMYTRNTGTRTSIHQRLVSGAGPETLVFDGAGLEYPTDWSPDAQFALIVEGTPANVEISAVPLSGEGTSAPGIRVTFPASAAFSPDGRWIAYDSAESGRDEVWVRPFLDSDEGGPWQISTRGGSYPRWARDGSELYYLTGDGTLMAVSVDAGESAFGVESSRELFTAANILLDLHAGASDIPYDVSPDGNRFLINERAASVSSESGNAQDGRIVVVVNWDSELRP